MFVTAINNFAHRPCQQHTTIGVVFNLITGVSEDFDVSKANVKHDVQEAFDNVLPHAARLDAAMILSDVPGILSGKRSEVGSRAGKKPPCPASWWLALARHLRKETFHTDHGPQ